MARCAARDGGWWPRAGRALASDPEALWYEVAHRLGRGHDFAAMVTELALLLLGEAGEVTEATLVEEVGAGAVGESWQRPTARPQTVRGLLVEPLWLLEVLGLRRAGGNWRSRWVALAEPGRALALEALHARATGPRPTGAAHDPCDRRWRWRAGSASAPARRKLIFGPESWRELAGGSWSHWNLWFCTVAVPGFDGDWARLSDEIMRHSPRAPGPVWTGLGGQAQPSGGPARTACRRQSGCRPARG